MPRTRGNLTLGEWPCRVNSSERFSPNALTRISTSPLCGAGIGRLSILRSSGPPASWITAAFMVVIIRSFAWFHVGCDSQSSERPFRQGMRLHPEYDRRLYDRVPRAKPYMIGLTHYRYARGGL